MPENGETTVLCGSNSYERKYYFNEDFESLPDAVKRQLQVMCVWFTEECGGDPDTGIYRQTELWNLNIPHQSMTDIMTKSGQI